MYTAVTKWVDGFQFVSKSPSNHSIVMDAGGLETGQNSAPTPMELMLMGLGGCAGIDVVTILQKQKYRIDSFTVETKGERVDDHPRIFSKIWVTYRVKGNVTPDALEKAAVMSAEKYCSVGAILKKSAEVVYSYEIVTSD